jgi:hypothetical protein
MDTAEKTPKAPERKFERVSLETQPSYDDAVRRQTVLRATTSKATGKCPYDKVKIVARHDGTFDVIAYALLKKEPEAARETKQETKAAAEHGLKSKDRKRSPKKFA